MCIQHQRNHPSMYLQVAQAVYTEMDSNLASVNEKHNKITEAGQKFWNAYNQLSQTPIGDPWVEKRQKQLEEIYNEEIKLLEAMAKELNATSQGTGGKITALQSRSILVWQYMYKTAAGCIAEHKKTMDAENNRRQNQNVLGCAPAQYAAQYHL